MTAFSDSSNSASTTPAMLTPDSTGTTHSNATHLTSSPESSNPNPNETAIKKARRQTAFYPNMNASGKKTQKPFSRSAAKRESVMALGSIEHLQYYFTKTGLQAKKKPQALEKYYGVVPAIGGGLLKVHTSMSSTDSIDIKLPPTPVIPLPTRPAFPHVPKSYEVDPESLLPGVIEDLILVSAVWRIDMDANPSGEEGDEKEHFDVLGSMQATTRAIRSIRNYVVSLPDESIGSISEQFRSSRLTSTPASTSKPLPPPPSASGSTSRPLPVPPGSSSATNATSSSAPPASTSSSSAAQDPLALIRRKALEVLTVLRDLEERCRLPLSDDAYDAQSDGGGSGSGAGASSRRIASSSSQGGRAVSPNALSDDGEPDHAEAEMEPLHHIDADTSVAFSLIRVEGRGEVPVWDPEDSDLFNLEGNESSEKRERWDERLVVGSGWLYRQDVGLKELEREREAVKGYLDVVDEVLFPTNQNKDGGDGQGKGERRWLVEKRKMLEKRRPGSRTGVRGKRRTSAGDAEGRSQGLGLNFSFPSSNHEGGKRRVSTGMIPTVVSGKLTDEPRGMEDISEEGQEEEEDQHALPEDSGEEESDGSLLDDDELPEWAQRNAFLETPLDRAHALLTFLLPSELLAHLPSPSPSSPSESSPSPSGSRTAFLDALSSGQLLCIAYNTGVRKSKQPWGYVNKDGVHDIIALEKSTSDSDKKKGGWTFRRSDNLRLWVGALKLRYMLPIAVPALPNTTAPPSLVATVSTASTSKPPSATNTPITSPLPGKSIKAQQGEPPIVFDAKVVAKKDEGWDVMLEDMILRWMWRVVDERRRVQ